MTSMVASRAISFRPHACGVDRQYATHISKEVFQTPRVWGRVQIMFAKGRISSFRPHACGEELFENQRLWPGQISDPTRVGWMMMLACPQSALRIFRPHACGVDLNNLITTLTVTISDPTRVGWMRSAPHGAPTVKFSDPTRVGWILDLVVRILQTTQYVVPKLVFANLLTES
jgi:hypothetical protein